MDGNKILDTVFWSYQRLFTGLSHLLAPEWVISREDLGLRDRLDHGLVIIAWLDP